MNALIIATVTASIAYIVFGFIQHCAASICCRHRAAIADHVPAATKMASLPLNPPTIEPMCFGEGVELGVEIPASIRALKQFVRTYSLQDKVRGYAGKPYSRLNLAQLTDAVVAAIA